MFKFKTHFILNEGGVAGHMSHVYENISLTGNQLKELFKNLIKGNKVNITEKVDGQNIFFTWDEISNSVRYARRITDIKSGGITFEDLKNRFAKHNVNVRAAFIEGGDIIHKTIINLTPSLRERIFGKHGNHWINAEIMHTQNPNLIQYTGNYIVLHSMQKFDENNNNTLLLNQFKILTKYLDKQTKNQSDSVWSVLGPRILKIEKYTEINGPYNIFCITIDNIFKSKKLNSNNTIGDFIEQSVIEELIDLHLPLPGAQDIAATIVDKLRININEFKKLYGSAFKSIITTYATQTNIPKIRNRITLPIQEAVSDLSIEVLKTLTSYFVKDHSKEINRIRQELRNAIISIENAKDTHSAERMNILKDQMKKLKNVENFCSTIEGIVFEEPPGSGQLYKLTGSFAPVNQILGLITYGKGNIPPLR